MITNERSMEIRFLITDRGLGTLPIMIYFYFILFPVVYRKGFEVLH